MRIKVCFLVMLAACSFAASTAQSQVAAGYEVGTWYDFKQAALTYSFDDNTSNQLSVAMPMFDQYGFKMSFNVITNQISNWSQWLAASRNGHEIASHTVSHMDMSGKNVATQEPEMKNSQTTINNNITNTKCLTFVYPYCNIGDISTMSKYYISGRNCSGQLNANNLTNFWTISSAICGSEGINTPQAFNDKAVSAKNSKGWFIYLIHGINGQGGYSPLESSVLSSHLSYINNNKADYWVATQVNVVKYIKERTAASITETTITADSLKMVLSDGLDNSIYDADISVRRKLPTGWAGANVYLGTTKLPSTSSVINGTTYVSFNVAPDKDNVFLANTASVPAVSKPQVASPVRYCTGDLASTLTATGSSLKWYDAATNGNLLPSAPVPSTLSPGQVSYFVSQTVNNVESGRAEIQVIVGLKPDMPTAPALISYPQDASATPLTAAGNGLLWYTTPTGGTGNASSPVPSTSTVGTTSYYVSQTQGSCESERTKIDVKITPVVKLLLSAGWNWVGCPIGGSTPVEAAMSSIWTKVETVKSLDAFYSTANISQFNSLKSVEQGKGYMVKVTSSCELDWVARQP